MALLTKQRVICNGLAQLYFDSDWPRIMNGPPAPETLAGLFAPKLATLRGLIEQVVIAQGRKAVVFSQWRSMLRLAEWATRDLLREAGMRAVFFTGAESAKLRERAIVELHDDPAVSVMFLSDAGGVGLNLQRAASVCVNLELPWNPAVLEQRIGRIYRLGQKQPIDVYNLVTEEGIEANIAKLVGQKSAVFSSLFDGTSNEVIFDGQASFMEGVKKLVEPVVIPESVSEDTVESELGITGEEEALQMTPVPEPVAIEPRSRDGLGFSVARLADGGLRIEAPAVLAAPLAELLESLAHSLRASLPGA
jgi:hypothetical protein